MAKPPQAPTKAVIEYEGTDIPPVYVEGAQGMHTPQGALQMSLYSEYVKPRENLTATVADTSVPAGTRAMRIRTEEPYGLDKGSIRIVRRIEANLILTPPFLRRLVPWLQQQLHDLEQKKPESQ